MKTKEENIFIYFWVFIFFKFAHGIRKKESTSLPSRFRRKTYPYTTPVELVL